MTIPPAQHDHQTEEYAQWQTAVSVRLNRQTKEGFCPPGCTAIRLLQAMAGRNELLAVMLPLCCYPSFTCILSLVCLVCRLLAMLALTLNFLFFIYLFVTESLGCPFDHVNWQWLISCVRITVSNFLLVCFPHFRQPRFQRRRVQPQTMQTYPFVVMYVLIWSQCRWMFACFTLPLSFFSPHI